MSSYVTDYRDLLKVANNEFEDKLLQTEASNFYENLGRKSYYNYLGRYYYNKSLQNEYYNRIIVVPKNGYITQRLVYLNDDLVGGTKVGVQAINITEQDGDINLQDVGAVGFCPLGRFFDSLCYAFGIEVDKSKIDIYSFCDSVLQNFEFVYNRESGLHITINSANFNNVHVLYIVEDEKTYFDEDLVQAFANKMYEAEWFKKETVVDTDFSSLKVGDVIGYFSAKPTFAQFHELCVYTDRLIDIKNYNYFLKTTEHSLNLWNALMSENIDFSSYNCFYIEIHSTTNSISSVIRCGLVDVDTITIVDKKTNYDIDYFTFNSLPNSLVNRIWISGSYDSLNKIYSHNSYDSGSNSTAGENLIGFKYSDPGYYIGYSTTTILVKEKMESTEGITIIDGAKLPTNINSLPTDYPNWFSRLKNIVGTAVETAGETLRNVFKVIEFVPLTLIGEKPTEPDNPDVPLSQDNTQTGVVLSPNYVGTLPEYTVKYLTPLPDTDTPINPDVPYVPIEDYTPSTPDEKYPWNSNPDTPIGNPVANPTNPPAIGGATPSIPDNPIVNASNGLFTVYNPTMEQLNQFGGYLWGEDIVGILQSIFQNPIDGVISLHILYATPETGDEVPIKVGYLTSTASAKKVVEQYINIDCGTINVPEYYGNVLDYAPFTKAHIYLPFIGIREINVNEIMGGQVNVNYKVDVLTGSVYASISVFHNAISQVLYVFEGNGGVQLPLTGGNMSRILSGVVTGVAFGALTGGVAGAVVGGGAGLLKGASVSKSGSVSSNAGAMGIKYPYIMITHSQAYMANNYNKQYGYPSNLTTQLSACKGYTRVKEVHVENILVATQEEKDMIQTLLRQGVIIE